MALSSKTRLLLRRIFVSILLVVIALGAGGNIFAKLKARRKEPERVASTPPLPTVRTFTARTTTYHEALVGYGEAHAMRRAEISAEVGGIVRFVDPRVEVGDVVHKGEILVKLDAKDQTQIVELRQSELEQAKARLAQTELENAGIVQRLDVSKQELVNLSDEISRTNDLVTESMVARNGLDQLRRQRMQTERISLELEALRSSAPARIARDTADVAHATTALAQARLDLERCVIIAPYDGRVEARFVEPGQRVAPGTLLFQLLDLSRVEVAISLPASRYREVNVGAAASIRFREGTPVVWEGEVIRVAPQVDSAMRTFAVYIEIAGSPDENPIPPGTFLVGSVAGASHSDVIPIPRAAFVGDHVYVVADDPETGGGSIARRMTPTVYRYLADVALVTAGIDDGAAVIISNVERLGDGSRVKPLDRESDDGGEAPR